MAIENLESIAEIYTEVPGLDPAISTQLTVKEVVLSESLLTPGLQTSVVVHSHFHLEELKNYDDFRTRPINIRINRPILARYGFDPELIAVGQIYRMSNRFLIDSSVEQFTLHACDNSLLNDAASLVSKSWKCVTPSEIVEEVLLTCVNAKTLDVEASGPARDYIAQNIHPFQVVSQNANAALAGGIDPSFIHYMTYEDMDFGDPRGLHHFRSLLTLSEPNTAALPNFIYSETSTSATFDNPLAILNYKFPCDFDILSDILNGVDENGELKTSLIVINPKNKLMSLLGTQIVGCGLGGGPLKLALTNITTAPEQDSCPTDVEHHLLLRQARMNLLEQDKIALRLTVPWNGTLHVGQQIRASFPHKLFYGGPSTPIPYTSNQETYGTGTYIICSLVHNIQAGGYATTTMDCITQTAGLRSIT